MDNLIRSNKMGNSTANVAIMSTGLSIRSQMIPSHPTSYIPLEVEAQNKRGGREPLTRISCGTSSMNHCGIH